MDGTSIPELGSEDSYKYLGLQQLLGIRDKDSMRQIEKKVLSRVHKLCKSSLSSRNKIEAIIIWAIPFAMYRPSNEKLSSALKSPIHFTL
jgi:hypothetical protein